ncbi:MAG TPA: hypothetical protein VJS38_11125 [Phenylobacterium sp.]|uniref:hypothetical protein n=1 Tax=Phenylobacterium sp. TaxID=1871053 RepID=UPI002B48DDCF|nr:hypothetical protein [Phenylobacterium sp.]HKR88714.1 hypothetical protein [Phenylobacterium sp.]
MAFHQGGEAAGAKHLAEGELSGCCDARTVLLMIAAPPEALAHPPRRDCCHVAAGTPVEVELVNQVSSAVQKSGDKFAVRLAAPLIVNGKVVLPAGTPGVGEVLQSSGPQIGGKPAKMVLTASHLTYEHRRIALNALQLARPGSNNSKTSQLVGLSGMAFGPLHIVGIVVPGGEVVFRPGTVATAKVAATITLPPLEAASAREIAATSHATDAVAQETVGPIAIPPPPRGQGQVVFFRPKSVLGTGQWFNVREGDQPLGKLTNGAYFVHPTTPGVHTYTAKLEPELKDHLTLKVDAGETYFVEGLLTGGLVIGAADLSPASRDRFNAAAKDLKLASKERDANRR